MSSRAWHALSTRPTSTARAAPLRLCAVRKSDWSRPAGLPSPPSSARRSRLKLETCSATSSTKVDIRLSMSALLFISPHHGGQPSAGIAQDLGRPLRLLGGGKMLTRSLIDVAHGVMDLRHAGGLLSGGGRHLAHHLAGLRDRIAEG